MALNNSSNSWHFLCITSAYLFLLRIRVSVWVCVHTPRTPPSATGLPPSLAPPVCLSRLPLSWSSCRLMLLAYCISLDFLLVKSRPWQIIWNKDSSIKCVSNISPSNFLTLIRSASYLGLPCIAYICLALVIFNCNYKRLWRCCNNIYDIVRT